MYRWSPDGEDVVDRHTTNRGGRGPGQSEQRGVDLILL